MTMRTSRPLRVKRSEFHGAKAFGNDWRMAMLTALDVRRLTFYKWIYSLESSGFTAQEAQYLLFVKWLVANGRLER